MTFLMWAKKSLHRVNVRSKEREEVLAVTPFQVYCLLSKVTRMGVLFFLLVDQGIHLRPSL